MYPKIEGTLMALVFPYLAVRTKRPVIPLRGRLTRPKPIIEIGVIGPSDTRLVVGLLDTGADDTIFPEQLASKIGIDLTNAPEGEAIGVGGTPVTVRFAQVVLRIATAQEQREWSALVGFTSVPLRMVLLGYAGVLEYFDANFRGALEEVELTTNANYSGS